MTSAMTRGNCLTIALAMGLLLIARPGQATPASDPQADPGRPIVTQGASLDELAGRPVRTVSIIGAQQTRPAVIRHLVGTRVDAALDPVELRNDRLLLMTSGAFEEVTVSVEPQGDGVAVTFALVEGPTYRLNPDLLITAENGLAVGAGIATANAEGLLIRGRVGLLLGAVQQTHIDLRAPTAGGWYGDYELVYDNRQRRNPLLDFFEVANEVFLTATPQIGSFLRAGIRVGFQSMRADSDGRTLADDRVDDVNTIGALVALDSRDLPLLTRQGWQNEALVERTGLLGGASEFWRVTLDVRRWQQLSRAHGLAFFGLGTWTSGDLGEEIAPWQQYHVGGGSTVRGWPIGERSGVDQAILTGEYRWTIRELRPLDLWLGPALELAAQAVFFTDAGLAWNGRADALLDRTIVGHGVGLHLVGPGLGRLRLELAWGGEDPVLRLLFGSGEKADIQRRRVR
jgi:outer membrane protein assembly factor BamA